MGCGPITEGAPLQETGAHLHDVITRKLTVLLLHLRQICWRIGRPYPRGQLHALYGRFQDI